MAGAGHRLLLSQWLDIMSFLQSLGRDAMSLCQSLKKAIDNDNIRTAYGKYYTSIWLS